MDKLTKEEFNWHCNQADVPSKTAEEMKAFLDEPIEILMAKINEVIGDGGEDVLDLTALKDKISEIIGKVPEGVNISSLVDLHFRSLGNHESCKELGGLVNKIIGADGIIYDLTTLNKKIKEIIGSEEGVPDNTSLTDLAERMATLEIDLGVTVETIEGGHKITITDAKGDHEFTVMNGPQGEQGPQGVQGVKGDAYTLTEEDKNEIAGLIEVPKTESLPEYVKAEAERVALNVLDKQNPNTFSILAMSDTHYRYEGLSMTARSPIRCVPFMMQVSVAAVPSARRR